MDTEPIAVALKFGFLAVLYLFLLWVSRSALRELRKTGAPAPEATGFHPIGPGRALGGHRRVAGCRDTAAGCQANERYDLFGGLTIGRSGEADVRIDDRFASSIHARLYSRGASYYVEDMDSTNGTFLNGGAARRARPSSPISTRSRSATPSSASSSRSPGVADGAASRRAGVPVRHRPPADRERGLLLRAGAAVRGRRRDGRGPGGRGRVADRRRVVRARRPRRASPRRPTCGRSPRPPTSASTAWPRTTPPARGWARR